jgi:hypothetical protein
MYCPICRDKQPIEMWKVNLALRDYLEKETKSIRAITRIENTKHEESKRQGQTVVA